MTNCDNKNIFQMNFKIGVYIVCHMADYKKLNIHLVSNFITIYHIFYN